MDRVEFFIESSSLEKTLLRADEHGQPVYFCYWGVGAVDDGLYTLSIVAYDTVGNNSEETYTLNVTLGPPPAPMLTLPVTGTLTNQPVIEISGTTVLSSGIFLYLNDELLDSVVDVDAQGSFSASVSLAEGTNTLQAVARYRQDPELTGPLSDTVSVILDTSVPPAPTHLRAESRESGEITLSWRIPSEMSLKGCRLYRATSDFTSPDNGELLNPEALISDSSYTDLPPDDGEYVYRVLAVNHAGSAGELSEAVSVVSDRTMPKATAITYLPSGAYDPATGRFGAGQVDVSLTVNETLQSVPFLSITPENGFPLSVELKKSTEFDYTGSFDITSSTPGGTAYAVFSARDLAGNRGTEIEEGGSLLIDTTGPDVTRLSISPEAPIRNDQADPVSITVTLGLSDAMNTDETPMLSYELSGPDRIPITLENLTQILPQDGEVQAWQGSFTLPADAGIGSAGNLPAETLTFLYQGEDDLANISQKIRVGTQDLRIASIVVSVHGILVTSNCRDFQKIPDLLIEDWNTSL